MVSVTATQAPKTTAWPALAATDAATNAIAPAATRPEAPAVPRSPARFTTLTPLELVPASRGDPMRPHGARMGPQALGASPCAADS